VVLAAAALAAPARAATSHTVVAGETLSGIAAANGMTTADLAAWNGVAPEFQVIEGGTVYVPAPGEYTPAAQATTTEPAATTTTSSAGSHVVVAGETLSGIAAANGLTTYELAVANGLAEDSMVIEGTTLTVPAPSGAATASVPAPGLGTISSPSGDLYLEASAADAWNAMRQDSLANFGQDLYPAGPASAYRTAEQQGDLYELYLSGQGAPANPPGGSSHELGLSVDVADPAMRSVIDQIGYAYGWGKFEAPDEWWHVTYGGG
jgi:LysM repeat protein